MNVRINAYLLAADPAWIEASVLSYYPYVNRIVVSYDVDGLGWTGTPIPVDEVLERLRTLDVDNKMQYVSGRFSGTNQDLMQCDTTQRQAALESAGEGADWVLQLDTDEVLPTPRKLLEALESADRIGADAVEWPMRILFRSLRDGTVLEVCARDGADRFEYPGPVAVRPGARLVEARRVEGRVLRMTVAGDSSSLQLIQPPVPGEIRDDGLLPEDAILHYSWAGSAARIRSKLASWSHNEGWRTRAFYWLRWWPAPLMWRWMRDFHPFASGLWPALKKSQRVPDEHNA